jgi:hypothetical protein
MTIPEKTRKFAGRPKNGQPWRPDVRDLQIYARACSGKTFTAIAGDFELTPARCGQICKTIDAWLAPQLLGQIREMKANHTSRLMHIYTEAMAAWERSKKDAESEKETETADGNSVSKSRKRQCGNPVYLETAMDALMQIREIWGADAPLQIAQTSELRVAGRNRDEVRGELLGHMRRITAAMERPMVVAESQG